jgi:uncharacterized protein YggE
MTTVPTVLVCLLLLASAAAPAAAQPCLDAGAALTHLVGVTELGLRSSTAAPVTIDVRVDAGGAAADVHVVDGPDDEAAGAIAAARASTYRPATKGCRAESGVVRIEVPVDVDEPSAMPPAIIASGRGTVLRAPTAFRITTAVWTDETDPVQVVKALDDAVAALVSRLASLGLPRSATAAGTVSRYRNGQFGVQVPFPTTRSQQSVTITVPTTVDASAVLRAVVSSGGATFAGGTYVAEDPLTVSAAIAGAVADATERARAMAPVFHREQLRVERITIVSPELVVNDVLPPGLPAVDLTEPTSSPPSLVPVVANVRVTFGFATPPSH